MIQIYFLISEVLTLEPTTNKLAVLLPAKPNSTTFSPLHILLIPYLFLILTR